MRYLIGFLIFIGLIVLVFVLFLNGGPSTAKKVPSLASYANTSTVVKLTIDGPVTAEQTHRQIQMTVGQSDATIDIVQGYEDTVLNHASYANNPTAYNVFLRAIDLAGFSKTRKTTNTDERGVCSLGDRYIYEVINGASDIQRTWSTTCGGVGTFAGKTATLLDLFESQIPDFSKLTSGVNVGATSGL